MTGVTGCGPCTGSDCGDSYGRKVVQWHECLEWGGGDLWHRHIVLCSGHHSGSWGEEEASGPMHPFSPGSLAVGTVSWNLWPPGSLCAPVPLALHPKDRKPCLCHLQEAVNRLLFTPGHGLCLG